MKLKIENNSNTKITPAIIMILSSKNKEQANILLEPYKIKIVSSTITDDTKLIVIEDN